jgi:hypothetical protein
VVGRWGLHYEKDTDCLHLLAAGADSVETTVFDTQRALAQAGLTCGHSTPESPPVAEILPWTSPTTVTGLGHAQGV